MTVATGMAPPSPAGRPVRRVPALAAAVVTNMLGGIVFSWSVMLAPTEAAFGVDRAAASAVFSISSISFAIGMLSVARLLSRFPTALLSAAVGIGAGLGMTLAAVGPSIHFVWLGAGVVFGVTTGVGYGLSMQVAGRAWPARLGLASGLSVAAFGGSPVIAAPLLTFALENLPVRTVYGLIALALVTGGVASGLLLRYSRVSARPRPGPAKRDGKARGRRGVFALLWIGYFSGNLAAMLTVSHGAAMVVSVGGGLAAGTLAMMIAGGTNITGRLLGGWLSDIAPARLVLAAGAAIAALALGAFTLWPAVWIAVAMVATVGLAYGMLTAGYPATVARIFGIENAARVYGRLFTATGTASPLAAWTGGLLYDARGDYALAVACATGAAALCVGLSLLLPEAERYDDETA
ncbi:MAG: MFS transporter [Rhodospirillaceae bacterium]|jgi:MFS transporter, OFA family, oxalate/formate antiporter|nr:MFS transporter [Rhodospirillaceae bacterium]